MCSSGFRQEDSSTTREVPGLGLGLSIAKHLAELQGGTLRAFSGRPGQGATFTLDLLAANMKSRAPAPPIRASPSATPARATPGGAASF